jgi:hypothetical protein
MPFNKSNYTMKKKWYNVLQCHNTEDHNTNVHCCEDLSFIKWGNYMYKKIK